MSDGRRRKNIPKTRRATVIIRNKRGLHARAAAKFVQCAERYDATVTVIRDDARVSGTSIMGLMMLAAALGVELQIEAEGPRAKEALIALVALVEGRFGEDKSE